MQSVSDLQSYSFVLRAGLQLPRGITCDMRPSSYFLLPLRLGVVIAKDRIKNEAPATKEWCSSRYSELIGRATYLFMQQKVCKVQHGSDSKVNRQKFQLEIIQMLILRLYQAIQRLTELESRLIFCAPL